VNVITTNAISQIVKDVFGARAELESASEIWPSSEYGIPKVCGCNANLSYVVSVKGDAQKYLFRFNRDYHEDFFDKEKRNYALVAANTDIPVPRIHCVDRSKRLVPVSFMIMDYMPGDEAFFLSHPRNPDTDPAEKDEIERKVGFYYAQMHNITRRAATPDGLARNLLYRLEQLEHVVRDGQFRIALGKIDLCCAVVEKDECLRLEQESLCVGDSELHFVRGPDGWDVSFICDMEWVDYGDPYLDLTILACAPTRLYDLAHPLARDRLEEAAQKSSFRGYEVLRKVDYAKLARLATYHQLAVMCSIADQVYRADKKQYMQTREPVYIELVEAVASTILNK